jgi:hypothetical protein
MEMLVVSEYFFGDTFIFASLFCQAEAKNYSTNNLLNGRSSPAIFTEETIQSVSDLNHRKQNQKSLIIINHSCIQHEVVL